ncbi:hypothetical protein BGZ73_000586 [Actinomortierella ambigua]|nr:hypothetical protein BGZ73_000586 [Actinomortierella ambigua]
MDEGSSSKEKAIPEPRVQFVDTAVSPTPTRPRRPPTPRPIVPVKRPYEKDDDNDQTASPSTQLPTGSRPRLSSPDPVPMEEPLREYNVAPPSNDFQQASASSTQPPTPAAPPSTPSDDVSPTATLATLQPSMQDTAPTQNLSELSSLRRALTARLMVERSCSTDDQDRRRHHPHHHALQAMEDVVEEVELARNRSQSMCSSRAGGQGERQTGAAIAAVSSGDVGKDLGLEAVWPWRLHHRLDKDNDSHYESPSSSLPAPNDEAEVTDAHYCPSSAGMGDSSSSTRGSDSQEEPLLSRGDPHPSLSASDTRVALQQQQQDFIAQQSSTSSTTMKDMETTSLTMSDDCMRKENKPEWKTRGIVPIIQPQREFLLANLEPDVTDTGGITSTSSSNSPAREHSPPVALPEPERLEGSRREIIREPGVKTVVQENGRSPSLDSRPGTTLPLQ